MLGFMDYVQNAFHEASHWNHDNSYSYLTATAQGLLDFQTPRGLRLNLSSLSSPNFATSYSLGTVGVVDGSLSYLYSSLPLNAKSRTSELDLHNLIRGYRHIKELRRPDEPFWWELWHRGKRVDRRDFVLYGRLFLPTNSLEALYLRRVSPTRQVRIAAVSDSNMNNGGTVLGVVQNDHGKYSTELLYSTDSGLLGARGLYNFGHDPRGPEAVEGKTQNQSAERVSGRFSAGAEVYYGLLNKSGGISTGLRFATLPQHAGFPYTMTLTLNPLMGSLSSTYAVKAGPSLALCSRFDFNFYSNESDLQLGCELWQRRKETHEADWAGRMIRAEWKATRNDERAQQQQHDEDVTGVLKARVDQKWRIGVLWEGRVKELLFTVGASFDLKRREQIFRAVGVEVQYSS
ncbi:uncharacterized protein IWZ02DRAFT_67916 [Phyllosticta citriasiana]|uniref:Mitochondrial distribution and morphology protein 10 n=1 Tax=Phyllosticta citriasiana TaxID=595635 RepID=A0ABR1K8H7_9PEZI